MNDSVLSHAEVWDDNALIQSWNDALDEYNKYHSISARGERVEDILAKESIQESGNGSNTEQQQLYHGDDAKVARISVDNAEAEGLPSSLHNDDPEVDVGHSASTTGVTAQSGPANGIPQHAQDQTQAAQHTTLPLQMLSNTVQDEAMKNLLMSWYYAGYYTGLHDGQKQLRDAPTQENKPAET